MSSSEMKVTVKQHRMQKTGGVGGRKDKNGISGAWQNS